MDVERTIEFILKSQAKAEVRMAKTGVQLVAIQKLLRQGMKMLVKTDATLAQLAVSHKELAQAQKRTDVKLAELAEAQKETDRTLKAFINSLRQGRNGR